MSDIKYNFMGPSSEVVITQSVTGAVTVSGVDLTVAEGKKLSTNGSISNVVNAQIMGAHVGGIANTVSAIGGIVMVGTNATDSIISLNASQIELNSSTGTSLKMKVDTTLIFESSGTGEIQITDKLDI